MKMANINTQLAFQNLLSDRTYDIEFNGYLSNHAKHAIIALHRLDAPTTRVQEYWDQYTTLTPYNLHLDKISPTSWDDIQPCTHEDWKSLCGKKERFQDMCQFLSLELTKTHQGDTNRLVSTFAPPLLHGMVGALTHGIIHLGWALDAGNEWMIIEGLAYLNYSNLSVHPEKFVHGAVTTDASVMDSLQRVSSRFEEEGLKENWIMPAKAKYDKQSGFHPELIPTGFQWELSKVLSHQHEVAYALPSWLDTMEDMGDILRDLYKAVTLIYLATLDEGDGHGNFVVLHLITSLWGLEQVLNRIKDDDGGDDTSRMAFKCFYAAMICVLSTASSGFPALEDLNRTFEKYGGDDVIDDGKSAGSEEEWNDIVARGIKEVEEHNIKLVYVSRELWKRYGRWSGFREAAKSFTLTPNVGPSSTSFKD